MSESSEIRGCILPMNLHYAVEKHTWVSVGDDGVVTLGMTDVAQNMAGDLLHAKPKKVGAVRKRGKPVATVESSKWVGPVISPITGEIVAVNDAVTTDPTLINRSPYESGWIVKINPSDLDAELAELLTGEAAVEAYRQKIESEDLKACDHVEGTES